MTDHKSEYILLNSTGHKVETRNDEALATVQQQCIQNLQQLTKMVNTELETG